MRISDVFAMGFDGRDDDDRDDHYEHGPGHGHWHRPRTYRPPYRPPHWRLRFFR